MTLSLCSVGKLEPRPQKTQILSPQPYCSSPPSDNAHKLVQQQISLFLEPKVVLCPSMIEEVVPVGCNVLHGGRRGRSLARQSPLHSLASQGHRVSTWGAKVRVRRRDSTTSTCSPTQPHPLSTLATQQLMWTCSRE